MYRTAKLSDDLMMRWELECIWSPSPIQRICVFLMLNPSTATDVEPDPSFTRVCDFAKRWGYDGIRIVNLVSFRSPYPKIMYAWFAQQTKAVLAIHSAAAIMACDRKDVAKVVVAHGKLQGDAMKLYALQTLRVIQERHNLHCIKLNKDGSPGHPLYLSSKLVPRLYFV